MCCTEFLFDDGGRRSDLWTMGTKDGRWPFLACGNYEGESLITGYRMDTTVSGIYWNSYQYQPCRVEAMHYGGYKRTRVRVKRESITHPGSTPPPKQPSLTTTTRRTVTQSLLAASNPLRVRIKRDRQQQKLKIQDSRDTVLFQTRAPIPPLAIRQPLHHHAIYVPVTAGKLRSCLVH